MTNMNKNAATSTTMSCASCVTVGKTYCALPTIILSLIGLAGMVVAAMMIFGPKDNINYDGTLRYWLAVVPAFAISLLAFMLGRKGAKAVRRDGVKMSGTLNAGRALGLICAIVSFLFSLLVAWWSIQMPGWRRDWCANNLKWIYVAYGDEISEGRTVSSVQDLCAKSKLKLCPECPVGGKYSLKKIGGRNLPVCNCPDHAKLHEKFIESLDY